MNSENFGHLGMILPNPNHHSRLMRLIDQVIKFPQADLVHTTSAAARTARSHGGSYVSGQSMRTTNVDLGYPPYCCEVTMILCNI
jgi:hypothetical protein